MARRALGQSVLDVVVRARVDPEEAKTAGTPT